MTTGRHLLHATTSVVGTATGPTSTGPLLVGVDVGGTKIAVLITTPDGAILGRATRASSAGDQDGAAEAIATTVKTALADAGADVRDVAVIGVGVPGRVDPHTGNVTIAVNLGWTDLALRDALEARLGRPCVIENDARAAAVGLHRRRVLGGADDIAYLAVGTGIAAGVILDGRLHRGARGLAGEIGHAIADAAGPVCTCGQRGCLEALVPGPSIALRAAIALAAADAADGPAGGNGKRSSLAGIPANKLTAVDVYEAASAGDALATDLVEEVGRQLAWAIHLLVMTYDVDRVVLGGGVSHAGETFMAPIQRELDRLRAASPIAGELLPAGVVAQGAEQGAQIEAAVRAGVDLLLCAADRAALQRIEAALLASVRRGAFDALEMAACARRVGELRAWLGTAGAQPDLAVVGCAAHRALSRELAERSVTLVRGWPGDAGPPRLPAHARILAIMPTPTDLTPADTSSTVAPGLARALRTRFESVEEVVVGVSPSSAEIQSVRRRAEAFDAVIIGTIEAIRQPAQLDLVRAVAAVGRPTVGVALRTPWDAAQYPVDMAAVCTYSILPDPLEALAAGLAGSIPFVGRLPVAVPGLAGAGVVHAFAGEVA